MLLNYNKKQRDTLNDQLIMRRLTEHAYVSFTRASNDPCLKATY